MSVRVPQDAILNDTAKKEFANWLRDLVGNVNTLITTVAGLGGLSLTNFIQNIGPGTSGNFTLTGLSGLTADKDVIAVQTAQPIPSKGGARDEFEMDNIELTGYVVDATSIKFYWNASGIVGGDYAFAYQVES